MTLMGDAQLRAALDRGDINLDPKPTEIRSASIDLRMGPEAFLGTSVEVIDMEKQRLLIIPPGELALVSILEKMQVGNRFAAQIGLAPPLPEEDWLCSLDRKSIQVFAVVSTWPLSI